MFSLAPYTLSALTVLSLLPCHSFARSLVFDDYTSRHTIPQVEASRIHTQDTLYVARDGDAPAPKPVVAHFMVGDTFPYGPDDWERDIRLAWSKRIDGFALNLGPDTWEIGRIADAFAAAERCKGDGIQFKLFLSFDMSAIPCSKPEDANLLRLYINAFGGHDSYLRIHDKPLVSTYAGQTCTFGQDSLNNAWKFALRDGGSRDCTFVPFFDMDPIGFGDLSTVDGAFNWNSGWPQGDKELDFSSDQLYINDLGGRVYMAAVSPWFSTHYGKDSFNKNWIYNSDNWLFVQRLEMLAQQRDHIDIVQIISWNDYGESHYVGPIEGAQPMSESWTTGMDHTGFLDVFYHYAPAITTGQDVSKSIDHDRIIMWGRLSPVDATIDDPVGRPDGTQNIVDAVWAIILLVESALVTLSCGESSLTRPLDAGATKMRLDLHDDCQVRAVINRNGQNTMDWSPEGYKFNTHPNIYNFNCIVAASPL